MKRMRTMRYVRPVGKTGSHVVPRWFRQVLFVVAACSPGSLAWAETNRHLDCILQPDKIVNVGSPSAGVIEQIFVERGDPVKRGEAIVQLEAAVERAALSVAREKAAQSGDAAIAASSQELAQRELQRARELHNQSFVSQPYLEKRQAEARVARGRSAKANEKRRMALRELELAMAQLKRRTIAAPISGIVIDRYLAPGEYFDQKPVMQIASIDPLRVDVLVPAVGFGQVRKGMTAWVQPEMAGASRRQAKVTGVDRVIDAASGTFRVRLALPNPNGQLPSGLRCAADLGIDFAALAANTRSPSQ